MSIPEPKRKFSAHDLLSGSNRISLIASSVIIIGIQLTSMIIIASLMYRTLNINAEKTISEMPILLSEPMYNVDDIQVRRIAEALISSNRVKGLRIYSSASDIIIDNLRDSHSGIVPELSRDIYYDDLYLGKITMQYNDEDFSRFIRISILLTLILLAGVLAANFIVNKMLVQKKVSKTFNDLITGLNTIAFGTENYEMDLSGYTDIDMIIAAINEMSKQIDNKKRQLQQANDRLEIRVAERTEKLETSLMEVRLMQDRLIESEKLSALGKLSAGIAHEFNTPLGAIVSSGRTITDFFDSKMVPLLEIAGTLDTGDASLYYRVCQMGLQANRQLNISLLSRKELKKIAAELKKREIPDPVKTADLLSELGLTGNIDQFLPLLQNPRAQELIKFAANLAISRRMIEVINESGRKASTVISALKSYLATNDDEVEQLVYIDKEIQQIIVLMHNILKHGISVRTSYGKPQVYGYAEKLSQVWMNLIRNAVQAMDYKGTLSITSRQERHEAVVIIEDSGSGIPEEDKEKIFEPFYSTRKSGEGMGLGLDICKRIIEEHKGTIEVESRPGKTVFTVKIPHDADNIPDV